MWPSKNCTADIHIGQEYDNMYNYNLSFIGFRQSVDISKSGQGTRVTVGHGGNLLDNRLHRLDASGFASKQFHPSGPLTVGGNLDYTHKPSG